MFSLNLKRPSTMPDQNQALPDRDQEIQITNRHFVNGNPIKGPFPENLEVFPNLLS